MSPFFPEESYFDRQYATLELQDFSGLLALVVGSSTNIYNCYNLRWEYLYYTVKSSKCVTFYKKIFNHHASPNRPQPSDH
jgi:hypothetical protein